MSSGFDLPGITNPITHVGRVVYNAASDHQEIHRRKQYARRGSSSRRTQIYEDRVLDDENFTIQPYELCMRNTNSKHVSAPNDTDIYVFSCANGMHAPAAAEGAVADAIAPDAVDVAAVIMCVAAVASGVVVADDETPKTKTNNARKRKMPELQFAGVASNRANYDPSNSTNEEMLAVQVGGLQTMYNTGTKAINAGDIILWDLPEGPPPKRIPGVPRDKKLFQTVSYKSAAAVAVAAEVTKGDLQGFLKAHHELASRVIGKALSTAQPGKPFDILLGHYCV